MNKFALDGSRLFEVYLHTNKRSGKGYIGITCCGVRNRLYTHEHEARNGSMLPFHRALRRDGIDGFTTTVLAICFGQAAARSVEIELIAEQGTFGKGGYNATAGGEGTNGVTLTAARRRAISMQFKALVRTAEHKKRIGDALRGRSYPWPVGRPGFMLGHRQDLVRKAESLAALEKAQIAWRGATHAAESKQAMRDAKSYPISIVWPDGRVEVRRTTLGALSEQYGITTTALSVSTRLGRAIAKKCGLKGCVLSKENKGSSYGESSAVETARPAIEVPRQGSGSGREAVDCRLD